MSDLISNIQSLSLGWFILGFLGIGLFGGIHCVGMCGCLMISTGKEKIYFYQIGRLASYLLLTFLLHLLGKELILSLIETWKTELTIFLFCLLMIFFVLFLKEIKIPFYRFKTLNIFSHILSLKSLALKKLLLGFFSIFLPCGQLYLVLSATLLLPNHYYSLLAMFLFWMGTLPAMQAFSKSYKFILQKVGERGKKALVLISLVVGLLSFSLRTNGFNLLEQPQDNKVEEMNCH